MSQTEEPSPPATPTPYRLPLAIAMAMSGAVLFAGLIWKLGFGYGGAWDPRAAWLLTPVFLAPLIAWLNHTRRLALGGSIALLLGITVIHFTALATVSFTYKAQPDDSWKHILDKTAADTRRWQDAAAITRATAEATALDGGRKAGAIGAFASFAFLLLFGPAFRRPWALAVMIAAGVVLTLWGGVSLSQRLPQAMTPEDYALWVFLPWQGLFGTALAVLFRGRLSEAAR